MPDDDPNRPVTWVDIVQLALCLFALAAILTFGDRLHGP